jgi:hypothetical protein
MKMYDLSQNYLGQFIKKFTFRTKNKTKTKFETDKNLQKIRIDCTTHSVLINSQQFLLEHLARPTNKK